MIEIVIKIPEELYTEYVNVQLGRGNGKDIVSKLLRAIKDGTPLPEHHGRLIDADALINSLGASDRDIYCKAVIEEEAPTIIEGSESK